MEAKVRVWFRAWVGLCCFSASVFAQPYWISTVAGRDRLRDGMQAVGTPLYYPGAAVIDRNGNLFIADNGDNLIRKVTPAGVISTYAGTGSASFSGDGGAAQRASINNVRSLAVDGAGNLYLADRGNYRVRKIDPAGIITTIAGTGKPGYGAAFPEGQPAKSSVITPEAVAVDANGNVYASDATVWYSISSGQLEFGIHYVIRKIDTSGIITTVAGSGMDGYGGDNGPAAQAKISTVTGIAVDPAGVIYLCDSENNRLRKVSPDGMISTVAGNGQQGFGGDDGLARATSLHPWAVAVDGNGDLYVVDKVNNRIRKIDSRTGIITTVAGTGTAGFSGDGGPARNASLAFPSTVSLDAAGNLYIADSYNARIRKMSRDGTISTVAGAPVGDGDLATRAFLNLPSGLAADPGGNLYIADTEHNRIRKVDTTGTITTFAGRGYSGFSEGGGKATEALFRTPSGVAFDSKGNLYIADYGNFRIRKVTPNGVINTIAGTGTKGFSGDGGPATAAMIGGAMAVALDATDNLYFADYTQNRIRKVTPAGIISTVAGNGEWKFAGDGGPATQAQLSPTDVALDAAGNLFVADNDNHRIRKVDTAGNISTVAGTGSKEFSGDGGPAKNAALWFPTGVAVDAAGNLYIADYENMRVRRVAKDGTISTIAGNGRWPVAGDGGLAQSAQLDPMRLTVDAKGNIFVSDFLNSRVRVLRTRVPTVLSLVGGDKQSGTIGQPAAQPLTVRVVDGAGAPMPGVAVTFAVTGGTATLNPTQAVTGPEGDAKTVVTFGATPGEVTVTATVAGLPVATFKLTAKAPVPKPAITSGGVVGASLSVPPVQALSPNGLVTILGENLAPAGTSRQVAEGDYVDGKLPTKLAGVCVFVADKAAPVLAVQPKQVTFQAPRLEAPGTVEVRVAVNCGTADEVRSAAEPVAYQSAAPEFVYFLQSPDGKNPIKAVNGATGENIGKPGLLAEGTFVPAKPDDILTLHAIGLGSTEPQFAAGDIPADRAPVTGAVEIRVGEVTLAPSNILYAGVAPWNPGLYLLEIRVPTDVADGDQAVRISVDGIASPEGGYIRVER